MLGSACAVAKHMLRMDGFVDDTCLLVTGCEGPVKAGLLGTQERPPGWYNRSHCFGWSGELIHGIGLHALHLLKIILFSILTVCSYCKIS